MSLLLAHTGECPPSLQTCKMKTQLTPDDTDRLNAARGIDGSKGLRPSVTFYNQAIVSGRYCGRPIIPIGAASFTEQYTEPNIELYGRDSISRQDSKRNTGRITNRAKRK